VVAYQHRPRATWDAVVAQVRATLAEHAPRVASPGFISFGSRGFFLMHRDESEVARMTADAVVMAERLSTAGFRKLKIEVKPPDMWDGLDGQMTARLSESLSEWRDSTADTSTT
jgi:hypothetical protein